MTKLEMADAIAKALEHAPLAPLAAGAMAVDAVLSVIESERAINLAAERSFAQQLAAAEEPWQQIHDTATGKIATAADLGMPHGSTGE